MAVTIEDIKKLRTMTGAGMKDCKKALNEADGDIKKAVELVRERGLAIAAKRSDRATSNGCVLAKYENGFAAMIALKCETDFVANGADYIALTQEILDLAIAAKAHTLDEVKALQTKDGITVEEAVTRRSGVVGEKMELDGYNVLEGANISVYDHMRRHTLATMVQLSEANEEAGYKVAMQVAAMKPVALDEASVPQNVKDEELRIAIEKTKEEQVERQVNVALKKAGINANLGFSEDDRKENIRRIAEVGKLFVDTGIITIASFISPTRELREMARDIIGADDFKEIYISTSLEACEARDVKGLYARARRGEVKNFTGISAPFEAPEQPALSLDTAALPLEESVRQLLHLLGIES